MSKHLVISIHGIWTSGNWQEPLRKAILEIEPEAVVHGYTFGVVSAYSLFPGRREAKVKKFAEELLKEFTREEWSRIDIVAHSFGTYIVTEALRYLVRSLGLDALPKIQTLILSGSVLKPTYPLRELVPTLVRRVVNDCGTRDHVLWCPELAIPGLGFAGRIGFQGLCGHDVRNRWFSFGHSGYFRDAGARGVSSNFMKRWWLPLLTQGQAEVPEHDARSARPLSTLIGWLERQVNPIRLGLIAGIFVAAGYAGWAYSKHERDVLKTHNRQLTAESWALQAVQRRDSSPVEAARLAIASAIVHRTPQTDHALLALLQTSARPVMQLMPWGAHGVDLVSVSTGGDKVAEVATDKDGNAELRLHTLHINPFEIAETKQVAMQGCVPKRQPQQLHFSSSGKYLVLRTVLGSCVLDTGTMSWKWSLPAYDQVTFIRDESALYATRSLTNLEHQPPPPLVAFIDANGSTPVDGVAGAGWVDSIARLGSSGAVFADSVGRVWTTDSANSLARALMPELPPLHAKHVAASDDGRLIAIGTESRRLVLVDGRTLKTRWELALKVAPAKFTFSHDGQRVAALLVDGTAVAIATRDGTPLGSFNGEGYPLDVSFLGDAGDRLLTVNRDTHIKIWDITRQSLLARVPVPISRDRYAFDPSGRTVLSGADDGTTSVWNTTWQSKTTSMHLDEGIDSVVVRGAGRYVAALGSQEQVRLWDTSKGEVLLDLPLPQDRTHSWRSTLQLAEHGDAVVLVDETATVRAWRPGKGEVFKLQLPRLFADISESGSLLPSRRLLPSTTDARLLHQCNATVPVYLGDPKAPPASHQITRRCELYNAETMRPRGVMSADPWTVRPTLALNGDGSQLAIPFLGDVFVFELDSGRLVHRLPLGYEKKGRRLISDEEGFLPPIVDWIAFSADGRRLLAGTKRDEMMGLPGNVVTSWSLDSENLQGSARAIMYLDEAQAVLGLVPDMHRVVSVAHARGDISFWDETTLTASQGLGLPRHIDSVDSFSWHSRTMMVVSHDAVPGLPRFSRVPWVHVDLYDRSKLAHKQHLTIPFPVSSISLLPDEEHLLVSDDLGNARTVEAASGRVVAEFTLGGKPKSIWFGEDGALFYTSGTQSRYWASMAGEDQIRSLPWKTDQLAQLLCSTLRPGDRNFADLAQLVEMPIGCDSLPATALH